MPVVRLYMLDTSKIAPDWKCYPGRISCARAQRAAALSEPADVRRSLGVELCLDYALRKNLPGYPGPPQYRRLPGGKPVLDSGEAHFSLAHAGDRAVYAIASAPVGVDIERCDRDVRRLAKKVLAPGETDVLGKWVAKESFLKMTGEGLSRSMTALVAMDAEICTHSGETLARICRLRRDGYCVCIAMEAPFEVEVFKIYAEEALTGQTEAEGRPAPPCAGMAEAPQDL